MEDQVSQAANQRALEQKITRLSMQVKVKNTTQVSSSSANEIGKKIKIEAKLLKFDVGNEDIQAAKNWMRRAGTNLSQRWTAAIHGQSSLPEASVDSESTQTLLTEMLVHQERDQSSLILEDVHSAPSVCGNFKPDIIGMVKSTKIPSATGFILDLKKQMKDGSNYMQHENIHQVSHQVNSTCREGFL